MQMYTTYVSNREYTGENATHPEIIARTNEYSPTELVALYTEGTRSSILLCLLGKTIEARSSTTDSHKFDNI